MPLFYLMFSEDLTPFFDDEFAGDQLVIQKTGAIFNGIFDRDYIDTNEIQGFAPVITCATVDASGLQRGDVIERGKELYKFIYEEPDGTGVSRLILESA